uniref:Scol-pM12A n=1 Tax=Scolopendra viridis TaxID=118503 RepID=A0A4D5R9G8_SCOVI
MKTSIFWLPMNLWFSFISIFFLIKFSQGDDTALECPDFVITEAATIQSPLYNEGYFANFRCWYNITAPEGKAIQLTFTEFNLPPSKVSEHVNYHIYDSGCHTDYVQWWETKDTKEATGRFCGTELKTKTIKTTGNKLHIVFQSFVTDTAFKGFMAKISFIKKGGDIPAICGNIVNTAGTFKMRKTGGNKVCEFSVKAPIGKIPQVNPLAVSVKNSGSNCLNFDLIQDNGYGEFKETMTTCSPNLQNKNRKQKNVQFVNFKISVEGNQGFNGRIEVSFIQPIPFCGGDTTNGASLSSTEVSTGRYIVCAWTVKKPATTDSLELTVTTDLADPIRNEYKPSVCMKDQILAFAYTPDPRNFTRTNWENAVSIPICGVTANKQLRIKKLDRSSQSHHVTVLSIMTLDKSKQKSIKFSIN